jgi:hypothetical protein
MVRRFLTLWLVLLAAATAPAHGESLPQTRVGGLPSLTAQSRLVEAPQAAETHQLNGNAYGETTPGCLDAAKSGGLAKVLEGHAPGQGFTGVFDASTSKVLIRPSTAEAAIPPGWVARAGGHADVSAALGGDAASHFGFAVILQEDGTLGITWRSGTLNPAPNYVVPPALRATIIDSVQFATGRAVNP